MSSVIETVTCYCLHCKLNLCTSGNSWEGIGKTYITSRIMKGVKGLKSVGAIKQATEPLQIGTPIENSYLQDVHCMECDVKLGLRCDDAPDGHLLKRGQYLLCSKLMGFISDRTGKDAILSITKKHPLKNPANASKLSTKRASLMNPNTPRPSIVSDHSNGIRNTPMAPPSPANADAAIITTICEQRKDIDRIDGVVNRLEKDMGKLKSFMKEVRQEMAENRRARVSRASPILGETFNHDTVDDVDALARDVSAIRERINEMDALRTEMYHLQARIKHLEENARHSLGPLARLSATPALPEPSKQHVQTAHTNGLTARKRRHGQADESGRTGAEAAQPLPKKRKRILGTPETDAGATAGTSDGNGYEIPHPRHPSPHITPRSNNHHDLSPILGHNDEDYLDGSIAHKNDQNNDTEVDITIAHDDIDGQQRGEDEAIQTQLLSQERGYEIADSFIGMTQSSDISQPVETRRDEAKPSQGVHLPPQDNGKESAGSSQSSNFQQTLDQIEIPNSSQSGFDLPPRNSSYRRGRPIGAKNRQLDSTLIIDSPKHDLPSSGRRLLRRRSFFQISDDTEQKSDEVAGTSPDPPLKSDMSHDDNVEIVITRPVTRGRADGRSESMSQRGRGKGRRRTRNSGRLSLDLDEVRI